MHDVSSLVCGLDIHKNSVYATVMSYGGEVVDKRKLPNDEVVSFLDRYPIDKVAMESSTSIVPIYRALREKGYTILGWTRFISLQFRWIYAARLDNEGRFTLVALDYGGTRPHTSEV